jgi:ubiquinone/menaquinone biosynthesis C-methylase UbiE
VNPASATARARFEPLSPAEAYDIAAPFYDEWKWQHFWEHCELPLIASEALAFAAQRRGGATLLDIGCGTGRYLEQLGPRFGHSIGIDVSERMLAIAAQRAPGRQLVRAAATNLPLPSASADLVLSTRMLSHVSDPKSAIAEMTRVLRPGGVLILSDVAAEHDYENTRLPLRKGYVFVETYKHSFAHLAELASLFGLGLVRSVPIMAENYPQIGRFRLRAKGKLGWIAVWQC